MEVISIIVPGVPAGQPRVKVANRGGHARVYNPTTITNANTGEKREHPIVAYKSMLKLSASQHYAGPLLAGPLRIDVLWLFPRTKGLTWKRKPMPRLFHTVKPDRDNLDKAVLDALKNIVIVDDATVCAGSLDKFYCAGDEAPRTEITITQLSNGSTP